MKLWIIAFQYWQIVFAKETPSSCRGLDYTVVGDDDLAGCFRLLVEGRQNVWVVCRQNMRRVVEYCMAHYIYIKAAGGIVHPAGATADRNLLIFRNSHWDMAKGKVETGETLRQAAVREVEEETGLKIALEGDLVVKTYHIYDLYGGWHLKQTSWYEMWDSGERPIVTQQEEGITSAEWCTLGEWKSRLEKSYSMMALIANRYNGGTRR